MTENMYMMDFEILLFLLVTAKSHQKSTENIRKCVSKDLKAGFFILYSGLIDIYIIHQNRKK